MRQIAVFMAVGVVGAALSGVAQTVNWASNLGQLAQDTTGVRATMQQVEARDKQVFAERLLRAVKTMPLTQEEKNARIARVAHELVAGAKTVEEKQETLSTIFAKTDPTYLSSVSDVLASGLDVGRNGLSQSNFLNVATNVIASVVSRTAGDPDALLRVTLATSTFIRAAGGDQKLIDAIMNSLGDSDFAGVVRNVVGPASKGDYEPMLAANEADRANVSRWYVGVATLPLDPLMYPTGSQFTWERVAAGGVVVAGIGGLGFGGSDALPPNPALPYAGQKIGPDRSLCCPPSNDGKPPKMVIK